MGGLAPRRFALQISDPKKIHGWIFFGHTPDWKGREAVAVVGELVEPQAMEAKAGTLESG